MPSLIMGIPRNWFGICVVFYLVPYNFGSPFFGLISYGASLVLGYMLTKYFDPDFADILVEKLKYISFTSRTKIYHD